MSLRRAIVEASLDGLNVRAFCRTHGISTWFFYDLRRRHRIEGEAALEPRSRAPKRVANRTCAAVEDAIVSVRKELANVGLDCGPATIRYHLGGRLDGPMVPSEATIWRVLTRAGCITPQPEKTPRHAYRSFTAERANQCWQLDDTGWELADGTPVRIIDVLDDHSRTAPAQKAVQSCTTGEAFDTLAMGAHTWGWPERLLTDNARAFRHGLADALAALGIAIGHSRPYHPQTCGKVERFHQTVKRFLAAQPPAATLAELQTQLDTFRDLYNHHRPHRALGRRIPADVWTASPKSGPATHPLTTPTVIHRGVVSPNGLVFAGNNRLVMTHTHHAGAPATVVVTGLACHVFVDGRLVRQLTLDPTRRIQPLGVRPRRRPRAL
jgi:transposase InsO family protein